MIVIPRWSGLPASDWYPWLTRTLHAAATSVFSELVIGDMPQPDAPIVADWVAATLRLMGNDVETLARTVLIGHSVGCQAIMRSLAQLPPGSAVLGTIFVAGWFAVDSPWPAIEPWVRPIANLERVKRAAGQTTTILSDNDPFTSDWQENRRQWQAQMGAAVTIVAGGQHFNGATCPVLVDTLHQMIGEA